MTALPTSQVDRRQFAGWGLGILAVTPITFAGMLGCDKRNPPARIARYRIAGPSMNPTFWGCSRTLICQSCGVTIRVDEKLLQLAIEQASAVRHSSACWHCGTALAQTQLAAALKASALPPDVIDVSACVPTDLQDGDILLVEKHGIHVKRLLGKPGQTVSVDDSGRLLVDGRRPAFPSMPHVAVDRDRLRVSSRWHAVGEKATWQRRADRSWLAQDDSGWLAYKHQNVYRAAGPGRVLDDYPGNLGIERSLYPADGLSLRFQLSTPRSVEPTKVKVWVAYWTAQGIDVQHQTVVVHDAIDVAATTKPTSSAARERTASTMVPIDLLSPPQPIGLRLSSSAGRQVEIRDLSVNRGVLYRINPTVPPIDVRVSNRPPKYPFQLDGNEWFVVGDNVPLSIDSRSWGVVRTRDILGRVQSPYSER